MGERTSIEWTTSTWNPWHGCRKVSLGCKNCYMFRDKKRYGQDPVQVVRSKTAFTAPLKWKIPSLIFTCSWSDWFISEADAWREEAWDIIRYTPHHIYQILTKRPERICDHLPHDWGRGWENVWLGVTIESQEYINRLDLICDIPSRTRFISAEPLLGTLNFPRMAEIDWVITGGESGPKARQMKLEWVRSIRDQCIKEGVPFFHKQHGGFRKVDGVWGGRSLDGRTWSEMPFRYRNMIDNGKASTVNRIVR